MSELVRGQPSAALLAALARSHGQRVRVTIEGRSRMGQLGHSQWRWWLDRPGRALAPLSGITLVEKRVVYGGPTQRIKYEIEWRA